MLWKHAKSEPVFVDAVEWLDAGNGNFGSTRFFKTKHRTNSSRHSMIILLNDVITKFRWPQLGILPKSIIPLRQFAHSRVGCSVAVKRVTRSRRPKILASRSGHNSGRKCNAFPPQEDHVPVSLGGKEWIRPDAPVPVLTGEGRCRWSSRSLQEHAALFQVQ